MSTLSNIKNEFLSFLFGLEGKLTPDAQAQVQAAASPVHQAISDAEGAALTEIETVAAPTLAAVLTKALPPEIAPLASILVQEGTAAIMAKMRPLAAA